MEIVANTFQYSKVDVIGHGAFAIVYKGQRIKNGQPVAVKCVTKKNLAKSESLLNKEISILQELTQLQHPNVVALHYCWDARTHVFLVMEYCNGGDLSEYLQKHNQKLSEATIHIFVRQLGKAMKALVNKGIVHRDLKPQNILLSHDPRKKNPPAAEITLKIADFGFARFLQDGVMAGTLCGSPMYMAPEVIMSHQYDAKADLWSLGTILFQCLTGRAPFHAQTPQQLKTFYEVNEELSPRFPATTTMELRSLLTGLLKRNAHTRMSYEEFFRHPLVGVDSTAPRPIPERTKPQYKFSMGSPDSRYSSASPSEGRFSRSGRTPPLGSRPRTNINIGQGTPVPGPQLAQFDPVETTSVEDGFVMVSPAPKSDPRPIPPVQRYSPSASPKATGPVRIQPIGLIAQPEPETSLLRASIGEYMELDGIPVPGQEEAFKCMMKQKPQTETKEIKIEKKNEEYSIPKTCKIQPPLVQFQRIGVSAEQRRASLVNSNLPESDTASRPVVDNSSCMHRSRTDPVLHQDNANTENRNPIASAPYSPLRMTKRFTGSPDSVGSPIRHAYVENDHKRNYAKLMFVKRFVDCIVQVINSKATFRPFDYDAARATQMSSDRVVKVTRGKRLMDQLVLHVKAMEILASSMSMASDEIKSNRLQASKPVLEVLKSMKEVWDQCGQETKELQSHFLPSDYETYEDETAEELLYDYAMRLCQNAALDEVCLKKDLQETARRYEMAQVLLHCLAQEATEERDSKLLTKYKESVESRLSVLASQGVVLSVKSDEI